MSRELVISPGRHMTRGGKEVYIACKCNVNADGSPNEYMWWVEARGGGYSVDENGRHLKNGTTVFDIVSKVQP